MKLSIVILLLAQIIMTTGCVSRSVDISDYYPLADGSRYTFLDGGGESVGIENIFVRSSTLGDGTPVCLFSEGGKLFGDTTCDLGNGCYFIDEAGLWTVSEDWHDDLAERSKNEKQLLLSLHPSVGDQFTIQEEDSYPIITLKIVGVEDIHVPAGKFKRCLKLEKSEKWRDGTVFSADIWLAKSMGVVKRLKNTYCPELADFDLANDIESEWNILRLVKTLAQEAGIAGVDSTSFSTCHPGRDEKIYFSLYGSKSADGQISSYKTISGVLDGIAESVISTQISTQYVYTTTIDGRVAEIGVEETDLDIVESVMEQFYSIPHGCEHDLEGLEYHWCSNEAPDDVLPHFFARDEESGDYKLWYSTGANSGTIVQFRIKNGKVIIVKVSQWIA